MTYGAITLSMGCAGCNMRELLFEYHNYMAAAYFLRCSFRRTGLGAILPTMGEPDHAGRAGRNHREAGRPGVGPNAKGMRLFSTGSQ